MALVAELDNAIGHTATGAYILAIATAQVGKELLRLVNEPIPEAEVELVRNYILGELCREYEERFAKSEAFINAWLSGEPFESVNDYIRVVRSVTPAQLAETARRYLGGRQLIEIVAGR
jgi:predicted Zn-dependent peptidase